MRACGATFRACVGRGRWRRGKKRARARLKILVSSSRAKGHGEARNREGIVIFKNFGQNLRAPDGRLGVSLLLSLGESDIVNGADTARCRMDRSFLAFSDSGILSTLIARDPGARVQRGV